MWSAGKLLLLGGALLLTYLLFAVATMRVALRTRDVTVPTLVGQTVNGATALLTQAGLNLKVEEGRRPDPKVPAGQILAQEQAGDKAGVESVAGACAAAVLDLVDRRTQPLASGDDHGALAPASDHGRSGHGLGKSLGLGHRIVQAAKDRGLV